MNNKNILQLSTILKVMLIISYLSGATHFCECEFNDNVWRYDEGTITENQLLPVTGLYFSDTDKVNEMGFFTLGPLICY